MTEGLAPTPIRSQALLNPKTRKRDQVMQSSNHVAFLVASHIPPYCSTGGVPKLTPSQWTACAKAGWSQPTTGAAHAGAAFGSPALVAVIAVVALLVIVAVMRGRRTEEPART